MRGAERRLGSRAHGSARGAATAEPPLVSLSEMDKPARLSGSGALLQGEMSLARFSVRARVPVVGQVPVWHCRMRF